MRIALPVWGIDDQSVRAHPAMPFAHGPCQGHAIAFLRQLVLFHQQESLP